MAKVKLTLDKNVPEALQEQVNRGELSLANGVEMPLSESDKNKVIYTKLESHNPMISDSDHGELWTEQVTASANLAVHGGDGETGVTEEDGLILSFEGTPDGEVAIDLRTNRMMSEDDAELEEETLELTYPRYTRYAFRLKSVQITDGPERRAKLLATDEQQRNDSESKMFSNMEAFFQKLMTQMGNAPENGSSMIENINPQDALDTIMSQMSPDQLRAQIEMREIEKEDEEIDAAIEAGSTVEFEEDGAGVGEGEADK